MQNWESIQAKLREAGKGKIINRNEGWERPRTRDEMIAHFETDWDKLKGFWAANPETAAGTADSFSLQQFDKFEDWKNWFIQQHPTNEIVMGQGAISTPKPPQPGKPPSTLGGGYAPLPITQFLGGPPQPSPGFDVGSPNYKSWNNALGNVSLPSSTFARNKFSGMTTGRDNPYYKNLFKKPKWGI